MKIYDMVSPLDYRYNDVLPKLQPFVSEQAFIKYQSKVEVALVRIMSRWGLCPKGVAEEVERACNEITAEQVYVEEERVKHSVKALVNCIQKRISDEARPFVHLTATSSDIADSATALRLKDLFNQAILPDLLELEKLLVSMARETKAIVEIGRTHGQYAEPLTFGFTLAKYVSRLGNRIEAIGKAVENLRGKMSGSVGAYNALSLIVQDPERFEKEVLAELGLQPAIHSTQIVEPQFITDLACSVVSCFSILANLADDFRHLQRNEIGEIEEAVLEERVDSSTMPQKINPSPFEHVKSMWKAFMPRIITVFMDEISEHQRDLTNSASSRFLIELFVAFDHSVRWLTKALSKVRIKNEEISRHVAASKDQAVAEPLYVLLAFHGYPNAYDYSRKLASEARKRGCKLTEMIWEDESIKPYLEKMTKRQRSTLRYPERYIGLAKEKTESVCTSMEDAILLKH